MSYRRAPNNSTVHRNMKAPEEEHAMMPKSTDACSSCMQGEELRRGGETVNERSKPYIGERVQVARGPVAPSLPRLAVDNRCRPSVKGARFRGSSGLHQIVAQQIEPEDKAASSSTRLKPYLKVERDCNTYVVMIGTKTRRN